MLLCRAAVAAAVTLAGVSCARAPKWPVVAEMQRPWEEEEQSARARISPEALLPTPTELPALQVHAHPEPEPHDPDLSRMAARVIGFPFRAVGWVLQAIF